MAGVRGWSGGLPEGRTPETESTISCGIRLSGSGGRSGESGMGGAEEVRLNRNAAEADSNRVSDACPRVRVRRRTRSKREERLRGSTVHTLSLLMSPAIARQRCEERGEGHTLASLRASAREPIASAWNGRQLSRSMMLPSCELSAVNSELRADPESKVEKGGECQARVWWPRMMDG